MKLNLAKLSSSEKLKEFDSWITSSLSEIKDTDKFKTELNSIVEAIKVLGTKNDNFSSISNITPSKMSESILEHVKKLAIEDQNKHLQGFISFLFMVTGKSDNNCKCQFPVYLRNELGILEIPKVKKRSGGIILSMIPIPRVLKDSYIASIVTSLNPYPVEQNKFLSMYVEFILNEDVYMQSLWSLGKTYFSFKEDGVKTAFLLPLVVYRVKGSVSATAGHEPEVLLRELLNEWGLSANTDFNTTDVIVGETIGNSKTRAYDFILPYNISNWKQKLFIQSQFYAGDSGSVSHKNVDQIRTSRVHVKDKISEPIFLEYVDGAGYFGSLNGDLKKIFEMEDTEDFFQIKTSPVKLRYHLQKIGFIVPLEIMHLILTGSISINECEDNLLADNYGKKEIERAFKYCFEKNLLAIENDNLIVPDQFRVIARCYLLLDVIVNHAIEQDSKGCLLIPGQGSDKGLNHGELSHKIEELFDDGKIWESSSSLLKDLQYLLDKGFIRIK